MSQRPEITLAEVRDSLKKATKTSDGVFRASDLIDDKTLTELREKARKSHQKKQAERLFDEIDALGAEIIARFGWETYQKWNYSEIPHENVMRWLYAERAREKANIVDLETIIAAVVTSCIRRGKKDPEPKGPKIAQKIINRHAKMARGEK